MRHMLPRDIWPIKLSSTCFAGDSGFCGHMCRVILAGPQPMSSRNLQSNRQWKVYGSEEVDARLDKFQGSQDPFQRIHDAVPAMKFSFLYAICRIPFYIDNTIQQKPPLQRYSCIQRYTLKSTDIFLSLVYKFLPFKPDIERCRFLAISRVASGNYQLVNAFPIQKFGFQHNPFDSNCCNA